MKTKIITGFIYGAPTNIFINRKDNKIYVAVEGSPMIFNTCDIVKDGVEISSIKKELSYDYGIPISCTADFDKAIIETKKNGGNE